MWHLSTVLIDEIASKNSASSPAPEVDCSVQDSSAGDQCAELKSIRIAERSCFDGKKRGSYRRSLSGMTYAPLTAVLGVERWMSLLPGSLVNPTALPAKEREKMTSGTSGPIPYASFAKWDQDTASWRTSQGCLFTTTTEPFSGTWPRAGIVSGGIAYRLPPLAPLIDEIGYGYLPTPTKSDAYFRTVKRPIHRTANTFRITSAQSIYGSASLADIAQNLWGGELNPTFSEWLMGWPALWTDLKPLAMGSIRLWLQSHGDYLVKMESD